MKSDTYYREEIAVWRARAWATTAGARHNAAARRLAVLRRKRKQRGISRTSRRMGAKA